MCFGVSRVLGVSTGNWSGIWFVRFEKRVLKRGNNVLLGLGRAMFNSCSKAGLPSPNTILISTHLSDSRSLPTTSLALRFIATSLCSLLLYQKPISVICESVHGH